MIAPQMSSRGGDAGNLIQTQVLRFTEGVRGSSFRPRRLPAVNESSRGMECKQLAEMADCEAR